MANLVKTIIFILIIIIFSSCNSINYKPIDFAGSNKRSYDIINKFKKEFSRERPRTFDTDTLLNFKTIQQIIAIYGEPTEKSTVTYDYPCSNILWILEGPLKGFDTYGPVLMMEWNIDNYRLKRLFLFVERDGEWISISNLLYPGGLQF